MERNSGSSWPISLLKIGMLVRIAHDTEEKGKDIFLQCQPYQYETLEHALPAF